MARILAISNQKGGVGKTTTTINLAASLAKHGQRVAVIDLDPQGNASSGLGLPRDSVKAGIYDALMELETLDKVVCATKSDNLFVVPATRDLVGAEIELVSELSRERRLKSILNAHRKSWDWILIDCPPSLGLLTVNALVAADAVLIPLQAEYYALEGLSELLRTIALIRKRVNPELQREGILLTMFDPRNRLCKEVEAQAREFFGDEVFTTVIPRNVRLGEAPSFGQSVLEYAAQSKGAAAYLALAQEILQPRLLAPALKEAR